MVAFFKVEFILHTSKDDRKIKTFWRILEGEAPQLVPCLLDVCPAINDDSRQQVLQ